jgi:3-deoxy-D-arabino-heptulosonate 7-phosphate (DAHP) synthase class II
MFTNVVVQEGSDDEDEYVAALEINNKKVLLLCSPQRGNSIRVQDDNHTIKPEEVVDIVRELCEIYNEKY